MPHPQRFITARIAGSTMVVDGKAIAAQAGCDPYTSVVHHVANTIARPESAYVYLTIRDDVGRAYLVVDPRGRACLVSREVYEAREPGELPSGTAQLAAVTAAAVASAVAAVTHVGWPI